MINFNEVGQHGATGKEAPLVFVDILTSDTFPSDPASRRRKTVGSIGDGQRACVVAVIGIHPLFRGSGGFLGRQTRMALLKSG